MLDGSSRRWERRLFLSARPRLESRLKAPTLRRPLAARGEDATQTTLPKRIRRDASNSDLALQTAPRYPLPLPRRRPQLVGVLGLLYLLCPELSSGHARPEATFSESLTVVERTVYADLSGLPQIESLGRRSPTDFLVRLDGAPAEVLDAKPGDPLLVSHLVWLDPELASPSSLAATARELAAAFETFPEKEIFGLVLVGPRAPPVRESLSRYELVLRLLHFANEKAGAHEVPPSIEQRIEALNRLAVEMARFDAGELGALWLAADPWPLEPAALQRLSRSDSDEARSNSVLGALQRASRVLASLRWVTFPVVARPTGSLDDLDTRSWRSDSGGLPDAGGSPRLDKPNPGFLRFILFGKGARSRRSRPKQSVARALDLATEIRLAPMAILARETSGAAAGDAFLVSDLATRLRNRRRLVARENTPPREALRKQEVVWIGGDGRAVPAVPWVSSVAPLELGIARLWSVTKQPRPSVGSPLRLRPPATPGGGETALCFAYPHRRRLLRLIWLRTATQDIVAREPVRLSELDEACAPLPTDLEAHDVVQLEAMDTPEWGSSQVSALLRESPSETATDLVP